MFLEKKIIDVIRGEEKAGILKWLLLVFSKAYEAVVFCRNLAYRRKWLKAAKAPLAVISVGNIVAGGTGKTPLVCFLAGLLNADSTVAILSRGYRSKLEHCSEATNISSESGRRLSVQMCGDEPRLLSLKVPNSQVWVGRNRLKSACRAAEEGAKVAILDDGMQYRSLERDFEIVVIDAADPFGKGFFLPRGFLRDHPKRLADADLIVATDVENEKIFLEIKSMLTPFSSSPLIGTQLAAESSDEIRGKKIGALCAIAKPHKFFKTLSGIGCELVGTLTELDHLPFSTEQLNEFSIRCLQKGAECLVCTEKDWVKLPDNLKLELPIIPLNTNLRVVYGVREWEWIINKIKDRVKVYRCASATKNAARGFTDTQLTDRS